MQTTAEDQLFDYRADDGDLLLTSPDDDTAG